MTLKCEQHLNAIKLGKANNGTDEISKQFRAFVKRGMILFMICEDDYFSVLAKKESTTKKRHLALAGCVPRKIV